MPITTSAVPWRIACQTHEVFHPETNDPVASITYDYDPHNAHLQRLRIVPGDINNRDMPAIEIEYDAGGYPAGAPVLQPRWLAPFERPDPNLYLFDEELAAAHRESLPDDTARGEWDAKRERYNVRRQAYEDAGHAAPVDSDDETKDAA